MSTFVDQDWLLALCLVYLASLSSTALPVCVIPQPMSFLSGSHHEVELFSALRDKKNKKKIQKKDKKMKK